VPFAGTISLWRKAQLHAVVVGVASWYSAEPVTQLGPLCPKVLLGKSLANHRSAPEGELLAFLTMTVVILYV
jgi:hypothetical protein